MSLQVRGILNMPEYKLSQKQKIRSLPCCIDINDLLAIAIVYFWS